jgi:hypothetical protein
MAIVIQICLCAGVAPPLTVGILDLPWDADQSARTKQRPKPDEASDPGGSEIPAASVA